MKRTKKISEEKPSPKPTEYQMQAIKLEENGKMYYPVHERIKKLKKDKLDYELNSTCQVLTDRVIVTSTLTIYCLHASGIASKRTFTGMAIFPMKDDKCIQKAETIAWGRALAAFGIGISDSIASADEMDGVQDKQKELMTFLSGTTNGRAITTDQMQDEIGKNIRKRSGRIPNTPKTTSEIPEQP